MIGLATNRQDAKGAKDRQGVIERGSTEPSALGGNVGGDCGVLGAPYDVATGWGGPR